MSLSNRFSRDLRNFLDDKVKSYDWEVEFPLDDRTRECVDVGGIPKADSRARIPRVLIEVELRREDPVSNVIKVWRRVLHGSLPKGSLMIQGFSRIYRSKKNPTKKLRGEGASIFGMLMAEQYKDIINYIPLKIDYHPRAGSNEGNGARADAAKRFGARIAAKLSSHS